MNLRFVTIASIALAGCVSMRSTDVVHELPTRAAIDSEVARAMSATGAQGMALLKDVPVWYELWRNINGFPPEYYKASAEASKEKKNK